MNHTHCWEMIFATLQNDVNQVVNISYIKSKMQLIAEDSHCVQPRGSLLTFSLSGASFSSIQGNFQATALHLTPACCLKCCAEKCF